MLLGMNRFLLRQSPDAFETHRLALEKIRLDHAAPLCEAAQRSRDNWAFIDWAHQAHWTPARARDFCRITRHAMEHDATVLSYVVFERPERSAHPLGRGRFVGMIDLHSFDTSLSRCQLGYVADVAMQGRGLMREAVQAVMDHGEALGIHRFEVWSDTRNVRSIRFAERLGFEREGVLRAAVQLDGRPVDHMILARRGAKAVQREAWRSLQ